MRTYEDALKALQDVAEPSRAIANQRFFKTAPGEYGHGDVFLGVTMPQIRTLVRQSDQLDEKVLHLLCNDAYHEARMLGFLCVVRRFEKAKTQKDVVFWYEFCLQHLQYLNNWDLVDVIVPKSIGVYLHAQPWTSARQQLRVWAKSSDLWEKRVAILACFVFIRAGDMRALTEVAAIVENDVRDLLQKALGWMLREAGKRDEDFLYEYLDRKAATLPRTTLRYAIERLPAEKKRLYMGMKARVAK